MPVILPAASYDMWLDPGFREIGATTEMLKPYDAGQMRRYAVSARVNSVANDDCQCSEPIEVPREIRSLNRLLERTFASRFIASRISFRYPVVFCRSSLAMQFSVRAT